jgi:hypothetical protein
MASRRFCDGAGSVGLAPSSRNPVTGRREYWKTSLSPLALVTSGVLSVV